MNPDDQLIAELREKIKSKMEVAKLLGTFLTGLLGGVLAFVGDLDKLKEIGSETCIICVGSPSWNKSLFPPYAYSITLVLSVIFILAAILLFFATVYAYDRLLMPKQYWPNSYLSPDLLYRKMIHSWQWFFNPAAATSSIGVFLLTFTLLRLGLLEALAIVCAGGLCLAYCWLKKDSQVQD